jgi:hypothetical protein
VTVEICTTALGVVNVWISRINMSKGATLKSVCHGNGKMKIVFKQDYYIIIRFCFNSSCISESVFHYSFETSDEGLIYTVAMV